MKFKIGNKFLTVETNPKFGETVKLKTCGASIYLSRSKGLSTFICPLQVEFLRNFIITFDLNHLGLNNLFNHCIQRDRYYAGIMRECNYYRDNPNVPTPIDEMGSFAQGMRHAQKVSLYASLCIPRFGLFLDRGIGKSKVIIDNLTLRILYGKVKRILIVCPRLNVFNTWLPEIKKHSKIKNLSVTTIVGGKDDKIKMLTNESRGTYIHVMTYDAMRDYIDLLGTYDILLFDESKALGGDSQRSLAAFQLSARASYVIMATGTVNTLKTMSDVFYQYKAMDLGATFGLKYQDFQEQYFMDVGIHFPRWVLKKGSLEVSRAKMFSIAISYKKSECLDLPPRTIKNVEIAPNRFQTMFMNAFVDGLSIMNPHTEIKKFFDKKGIDYCKEAQAISDAIPFSKIIKLQEITSGFYIAFTDPSKTAHHFNSSKFDALVDTLSTIGDEKVIVWCRFIHDIEAIAELLKKKKIKSCLVHGRKDEVKKWQKSKSINVLIGMESVGKGLTLNEAAYMIYYSYDNFLEHWNQSIDRNYRSGQTRNTTVYIIQVKNSVDQAVIHALNSNETFSKKLTDYKFKRIARGK
jgi:SNF2 family DNA or RNA helicase